MQCERIGTAGEALLAGYRPRAYEDRVGGKSMAAAGCRPILHMRDFQAGKKLGEALRTDILSRNQT